MEWPPKDRSSPGPQVCPLHGYLYPHAARLVSWLISPEMLARVSLPKLWGQDDTVAIPGTLCISFLPCAMCLHAHSTKSQLSCLPLSWNSVQDLLGGLRGIKIVTSHNLSKILFHEFVFSLLRLHLSAQTVSTKIYSWYFFSVVNSLFPGALG